MVSDRACQSLMIQAKAPISSTFPKPDARTSRLGESAHWIPVRATTSAISRPKTPLTDPDRASKPAVTVLENTTINSFGVSIPGPAMTARLSPWRGPRG